MNLGMKMFKQSRKRIVASIMAILTLLWITTLCVIYIASYVEVSKTNYEMLQEHASQYMLEKPLTNQVLKPPLPNPHFDNHKFKLSTFYSVALDHNQEIIEIKNDHREIYSNDNLQEIALKVINNHKDYGKINELIYYKMDKGDYLLISFMDNTLMQDSMNTLFRYTLIVGAITITILFFLALYLAKRIVDPLEISYQKQKQFISDAGHELKTPLCVINTNAELLEREIGSNQWLANIQYENERMSQLVIQLLELARSENPNLIMEHLDLSNLVNGDILTLESLAFEHGLTINPDIQDNIMFLGNKHQLNQLVTILLDNAIKYSTNGKEVKISLKQNNSHIILTVINDGIAIPKEQQALLFERFYRLDEVRNDEEKHYGLGLAIAKAIVDSHHGKISVNCYNHKVCFIVKFNKIQ